MTDCEAEALLDSLCELDRTCGPDISKHDRAIVLIHACIDAGCNTKARILDMLQRMNCNPIHARIILSKATGTNPALHRWQRDAAGTYRSHP